MAKYYAVKGDSPPAILHFHEDTVEFPEFWYLQNFNFFDDDNDTDLTDLGFCARGMTRDELTSALKAHGYVMLSATIADGWQLWAWYEPAQ